MLLFLDYVEYTDKKPGPTLIARPWKKYHYSTLQSTKTLLLKVNFNVTK